MPGPPEVPEPPSPRAESGAPAPRTRKDGPTRRPGRPRGSESKSPRVGPSDGILSDMPVRQLGKGRVGRIIYGALGEAKDKVLMARALDTSVKHDRPFGARDGFSRGVMAMVAAAGDEVKARIASDPEMAEWYWAALRQGVKLGDSTSLQLYTKILKLVDEEKQVVVTVLHQLGMSSMEELERLVEVHREGADVTPEQRAAVCADYLELYLNAHPVERRAIVRRLGGEVAVRSDSYATVEGEGG